MSEDRVEKLHEKEKKNKEPSVSVSIQPSLSPAPERTDSSPPATEREKDNAKEETGEVKEMNAGSFEGERERQPFEKVQKRGGEKASKIKQEEEKVEMKCVVDGDKAQNGKEELVGGSLLSPLVSSSPSCPLGHVDSIVDKHLGDFSSEMRLVLQGESIHYSFPESSPSSSHTDATAIPHTHTHTAISQFSQYVSFYNPCPPVQDYVSSLQDSIDSMLMELNDTWPSHKPAAGRTNTDATLASEVSAFVSSIRAAKAKTGTSDGGEATAADVGPSDSQSPVPSRGGEVQQPHTSKQFPDAANNRSSPASPVTLPVTTSASGCVYKPTNAAVHHPPPGMSPQSLWKPQLSHSSEITHSIRPTQDNSITRTIHCTAAVESGSSFAGPSCEVTSPGFSGVSKPLLEPSHPSEPASTPAPVSVPGPRSGPSPPATALSSLISQLQPEVFTNLVEIIKDVKRNCVQFYLHSTEPGDQVYEDVKVTSWAT